MSAFTDALRAQGDALSIAAADEIDHLIAYKSVMVGQFPRCRQIINLAQSRIDVNRRIQLTVAQAAALAVLAGDVPPDPPDEPVL